MIGALRLDLRRSRAVVAGIGLLSALYAGFITAFYPVVLENAAASRSYGGLSRRSSWPPSGSGRPGRPGHLPQLVRLPVPLAAPGRDRRDRPRHPRRRGRRSGFLDLPLSTRLPRTATWRHHRRTGVGPGRPHLLTVATCGRGPLHRARLRGRTASRSPACTRSCWLSRSPVSRSLLVVSPRPRTRGRVGGRHPRAHVPGQRHRPLSRDMGDVSRLSAFRYFDLEPLIDAGPTRWATRCSSGSSRPAAGCSRSGPSGGATWRPDGRAA